MHLSSSVVCLHSPREFASMSNPRLYPWRFWFRRFWLIDYYPRNYSLTTTMKWYVAFQNGKLLLPTNWSLKILYTYTVVDWIMAPKDVYILISGPCECYFIWQILWTRGEVKDLEMGILSWVFWLSPKCHHSVLIRGRPREISDGREGNVITETEIGVLKPQTKESWEPPELWENTFRLS